MLFVLSKTIGIMLLPTNFLIALRILGIVLLCTRFASLGRSYGKEEVVAMLEPAWDYGRDAWMAARVAALRGVENGYAVVHSARRGVLSASDRYGRFVAETPSGALPGAAIIAQVPVESRPATLYTRFGDWFGWLCVVGAALLRFLPRSLGLAIVRNRR